MSHAYHRYTEITLDPDIRRCAVLGCKAVGRVAVTRPAPSIIGSATSEEAARRTVDTRRRTRVMVWTAFLSAGKSGLTDEEGITATGLGSSTYRPRRVALVADSLIEDSGQTRLSKSGRRMVVWVGRA